MLAAFFICEVFAAPDSILKSCLSHAASESIAISVTSAPRKEKLVINTLYLFEVYFSPCAYLFIFIAPITCRLPVAIDGLGAKSHLPLSLTSPSLEEANAGLLGIEGNQHEAFRNRQTASCASKTAPWPGATQRLPRPNAGCRTNWARTTVGTPAQSTCTRRSVNGTEAGRLPSPVTRVEPISR